MINELEKSERNAYEIVREMAEKILDCFYGPSGQDIPLKTQRLLYGAYRTLKAVAKKYESDQPMLDLWDPPAPGSPFKKRGEL
jgi:predicted butyrate kinase (DUF1464 family)